MADANHIRQTMDGVFRLIQSGQYAAAEEACRSCLETNPDDVNVLGLLGAILLKLGRPSDAKPILERATHLEPGFAKPFEDLGELHLEAGKARKAVGYFEESIRLDGEQASAWSGLANALLHLGENDRAQAARRKFLALSPATQALDEALRQKRLGDVEKAERLCEDVLKSDPANTDALRLLATIATDDERYVIAEGLLKRIVKLASNHYLAYSELGRFLADRGRFPEAIEQLRKATELDPTVVENVCMLGDVLSIVGRTPDAHDAYQRALQMDPDNATALTGLGHSLRILGKPDGAITAYERCLVAHPKVGDSWWSLATMSGYEFSTQQIDTMREQLKADDCDEGADISLNFALARGHEAQHEFNEAWNYYEQGNSLKRSQIDYDPVHTEVTHNALIESCNRELLCRTQEIEDIGPIPIFIVGMPRSGSTLLEQILASHSQVEGGGELPYVVMLSRTLGAAQPTGARYPEILPDMTQDQLLALGQSYLYHTKSHRKQQLPYFTDKMPANFSHVGLIHLALPNARIIDARRHPLDTCVGNFRQLFAQGKNQSYDLFEMAYYYLEYHRIMEHWDAMLPGRVLRVQYEDVVADLEGQSRRLLEYCGLPWEDACLDFYRSDRPVNTASAEQVRQPIYTESIAYWKNYESHLTEVLEILEPIS